MQSAPIKRQHARVVILTFLAISAFSARANAKSDVRQNATPARSAAAAFPRVVVIGLDGASLNLLEPYVRDGTTPNIAALMQNGVYGDLASIWPLRTPQVWTSIATGKLPGQHGIWDNYSDTYFNPPGFRTEEKRALTTAERRSKALWNILSERGLQTLSVGWIASWPAESVPNATLVAPSTRPGSTRQVTIKGAMLKDDPQQVAPAKLWPQVQRLVVEPDAVATQDLAKFADVPATDSPLYELPFLRRYTYALRWSLARSQSVEDITRVLAKQTHPDLVLAYFECSDSLLHRFWIFHKSVAEIKERLEEHHIASARASELKEHFGHVVEACYRDLDARIGRMLAELRGPQTLVLVVSDHGFGDSSKPHRLADEPYSGDHRDDGVLIAAGPSVTSRASLKGISVLDITPTILHALGLPVADDMRGRVITALTEHKRDGARPIQHIASYEKVPQLEAPFAQGWPLRQTLPKPTDTPKNTDDTATGKTP